MGIEEPTTGDPSGVPEPRESPSSRQQPDLRVGDTDRTAALRALDRHLEEGRLGVEEYSDRSAAAALAVRSSELAALFVDLPAPHPPLPSPFRPSVAEVSSDGSRSPSDSPVRHGPPVPAIVIGLVLMLLVVAAGTVGTLAAGHPAPGAFVFLPLLFMVMGGLRHRRRGPWS